MLCLSGTNLNSNNAGGACACKCACGLACIGRKIFENMRTHFHQIYVDSDGDSNLSKVSHTGFDSCWRSVMPIQAGLPEKQMGVAHT